MSRIFENISFDVAFERVKNEFLSRAPEFDALVESDPAIKLLEIAAYQEMLMRVRILDGLKANLLAYAAGEDLDNLAQFYGVDRLQIGGGEQNPVYETDDALRTRISNRIKAWSSAGTAEHYRYHALQVDTDQIKDARAYSPTPGLVRIAILANTADGAPNPELLDKIRDVMQGDTVRVLTDTVEIVPCELQTIDIAARVMLKPDASWGTEVKARDNMIAQFEANKLLGRDITRSWIAHSLFVDGVQDVLLDEPVTDLVVPDNGCAILSTVIVTSEGRAW
jgi:phage-related baseplate assembly protein